MGAIPEIMQAAKILPSRHNSIRNAQDVFWCKQMNEDAFLFTLDNAPYFLYEVLHNTIPLKAEMSFIRTESFDALFMLTNQTCFNEPVAKWLSTALASHYRLSQALTQRIHTAMHEAISNAVIHGNLGVHGRFRNASEFEAYYGNIRNKLAANEHLEQRVTVAVTRNHGSLTVHINDEGRGYTFARSGPSNEPLMVERGLTVIRELCPVVTTLRAGSTIQMHFTVS